MLGFFQSFQQKRIGKNGVPAFHADDYIRATCPMRFGKIGRGPSSGMIGMRVIEADNVMASQKRFVVSR
jgi:hypothetical protein